MGANQQLMTDLVLSIRSDTADLKKGINEANNQINGFKQGISNVGKLIAGAFTVTAIVGFAKSIFEFGSEIDDLIGKIDDLGNSLNVTFDAAKVKAIADTFGVDIDKVITAANGTAKQFGITFTEALGYIQQGLSLAGTQSEKYLKSLESQAAGYANLGGSASDYFTIVTNGYRTSSEFEKQLKDGVNSTQLSWERLTGQMNEGQLIQQRLIESSTELNKVWTDLFDGQGDAVDKLHTSLNEIAVVTLKGVQRGIVNSANFMIELYNNSLLFRTVIQAVVLNFKLMWATVKGIAVTLYDAFSNAGSLIKALLTGDWGAIPNIIKKGFSDLVENGKTFASDFADAFTSTYDNIANNQPIKLISLEEVENQGKTAGQRFAGAFKSTSSTSNNGQSIPLSLSPAGGEQSSALPLSGEGADLEVIGSQVTTLNTQLQETSTNINEAGNAFAGFGASATEALAQTSAQFVEMAIQGKASLKDLVSSALKAIGQIIAKLLVQAIVGLFAGESSKGVIGLGIAAAGVGVMLALIKKFSSKSQGFAHGGLGSGQFLVGENGPEVMSIGNTVARITPNHQLGGLFNSNGGGQMGLVARVSGRDLEFVLSEQQRTRLNTT